MTPRELFEISDFGSVRDVLKSPALEGQYFELKEHRQPDLLAQTVSAFANSNPEGGLIIIGIADRDNKADASARIQLSRAGRQVCE